jgi:hypothetical protein
MTFDYFEGPNDLIRQTHLYLGQKYVFSLVRSEPSLKELSIGFFVDHDKLLDQFFRLCFQVSLRLAFSLILHQKRLPLTARQRALPISTVRK